MFQFGERKDETVKTRSHGCKAGEAHDQLDIRKSAGKWPILVGEYLSHSRCTNQNYADALTQHLGSHDECAVSEFVSFCKFLVVAKAARHAVYEIPKESIESPRMQC